jgi:hypothetical protein
LCDLCLCQSQFVSLRTRSNSLSLSMAVSLFPYAQNPTLYLCLWQSEFVSLRTRSNSLSLSMAVRVCFPTHKIQLSIFVYDSQSLFPYTQDPTLYLCLWQSELVSVRARSNSISLSMGVRVCFPTHKDLVRRETNSVCLRQR